MFSEGLVHFWVLTSYAYRFVCCIGLLSALFLQGLLQPVEMRSVHPVLSGFTEIGCGAKMCLACMHLGISDKKGCSLLTGMRCLDFFYLCVYDQKMIDLCSNLLIL